MKAELSNQNYILKDLAIEGQITVFYAEPNAGKTLITLKLLCETLEENRVEGGNVYYINADDNAYGLVAKTEVAERYGFEHLVPGKQGFKAEMLTPMMQAAVKDKTAKGKILILDTAKKFTDLMDKKASSAFMNVAREFIVNGGSIIMLAHVNKNKGRDGKSIHAGTTDLIYDADCVFTIDVIGTNNDRKTVSFRNNKARGAVESVVNFSYSDGKKQPYQALLNSVKREHTDQAEKVREDALLLGACRAIKLSA